MVVMNICKKVLVNFTGIFQHNNIPIYIMSSGWRCVRGRERGRERERERGRERGRGRGGREGDTNPFPG